MQQTDFTVCTLHLQQSAIITRDKRNARRNGHKDCLAAFATRLPTQPLCLLQCLPKCATGHTSNINTVPHATKYSKQTPQVSSHQSCRPGPAAPLPHASRHISTLPTTLGSSALAHLATRYPAAQALCLSAPQPSPAMRAAPPHCTPSVLRPPTVYGTNLLAHPQQTYTSTPRRPNQRWWRVWPRARWACDLLAP